MNCTDIDMDALRVAMAKDARAVKWACKTVWNEGTDSSKKRLKPRNGPQPTSSDRETLAAAYSEAAKARGMDVRGLRGREVTAALTAARRHAWAIAASRGVNAERISEIDGRHATGIRAGIKRHNAGVEK